MHLLTCFKIYRVPFFLFSKIYFLLTVSIVQTVNLNRIDSLLKLYIIIYSKHSVIVTFYPDTDRSFYLSTKLHGYCKT